MMEVEISPNTSAVVTRPGLDEDHLDLQPGRHRWTYTVPDSTVSAWTEGAAP